MIGATLEELSLEGEGDTPDGKLSLRYNTCLGACAQAPVISLDHHLIGRQSADKTRIFVKGLLDQATQPEQDAR